MKLGYSYLIPLKMSRDLYNTDQNVVNAQVTGVCMTMNKKQNTILHAMTDARRAMRGFIVVVDV